MQIVLLISFAIPAFLAGCSRSRFSLAPNVENDVAVITDGLVFQNCEPAFVDLRKSGVFARKVLSDTYAFLINRGCSVRSRIRAQTGSIHKDSLFLVCSARNDTIHASTAPFSVKREDTVLTNAVHTMWNSFRVLDKTDQTSNLIQALNATLHEKYVFVILFVGLDSEPVSEATQGIWAISSFVGSGGMLMIIPSNASSLECRVLLIDLDNQKVVWKKRLRRSENDNLGSVYKEFWQHSLPRRFPIDHKRQRPLSKRVLNPYPKGQD
jgi:hypothetical protein